MPVGRDNEGIVSAIEEFFKAYGLTWETMLE